MLMYIQDKSSQHSNNESSIMFLMLGALQI